MGQIKMKREDTRKYEESVCNIEQIAGTLYDIQKYLTFIHAFRGCDTTSAIFGKEKLSIFQYFNKIIFQRKEKKEVW